MTISQYNKKWPFKKQKCTRTTPRQHLVPLQNIHATQRLTSYDHMTYLKRNKFKGFTNSDKKQEFKETDAVNMESYIPCDS